MPRLQDFTVSLEGSATRALSHTLHHARHTLSPPRNATPAPT
jgi:hypothetical protein